MKKKILGLIIFFGVAVACSDSSNEDQLVDLDKYNMKVIPESPGPKDEIKLVIYDDCTYNTLFKNKRTGKTIDIEKQFNSMMKWPCMMKNDTILIGKLPEGTYTVNYKLLDTSTQATNPTALSFSFSLSVSR